MKYIFNADDFGRTETVNKAIVEGFENGCLNRTTIMVNMPCFEQAVQLSERYGFKDKVGLHINLTSGIPLTDNIKKYADFCTNGEFNGSIFENKKLRLFISKKERLAVKEEIEAHIKKYLSAGFTLKHADSHGHVHTFPSILPQVIKSLKRYQFISLRISTNVAASRNKKILKSIINFRINSFNQKSNHYCDYFDSYLSIVRNLEEINGKSGYCEIMLHPNIWDGEYFIGERQRYSDIDVRLLGGTEYGTN